MTVKGPEQPRSCDLEELSRQHARRILAPPWRVRNVDITAGPALGNP